MKACRNRKRVQSVGQAVALIVTAGLSIGAANAQNTVRPASKDAAPAQTRASQATDPLAGAVRTPDGKPVKDAAVFWIERARDGKVQRRYTADTDAQGRFAFAEPLPKPGQSYVTLLVQAQDWGLTFQDVPSAEPPAALTITLKPAVALRVSFVDQAGKPLANVPIRVRMFSGQNTGFLEIPAAMHGRWEQKTNGAGECVFGGLPQGVQVQFAVMSDAYAALSYEDAVALGGVSTQRAAPIRLIRSGSVQGRVTNAGNGEGVAGVWVGAQAVGVGDGWGEAVTDAQGNYRMTGLRAGAYNIALFTDDERRRDVTARALEKVDVKPGSILEHQDLSLIKGSVITGKVTDKNTGNPVEGVIIGIYGPATPAPGLPCKA